MIRSLRRRIWESLAATTLARLVQVGYAFVLVPLLLGAWGVEVYGEWIVLTAIASFGSLANFGVVQASASEMMLAVGTGDRDRASRLSVTSLLAGAVFILLVLSAAWAGFSSVDVNAVLGVSTISPRAAFTVVMLALAGTVLAILSPPLSAALSVVVGNALTTVVSALIKAGELLAIAVAAFAGAGPIWITAILVGSATVNIAMHFGLVRYFVPWLSFDARLFDVTILRELIRPSLAQFLISISASTLAIQLPRIVLGHVLGPTAVASFTVTVTYMRAARALTTLFSQSLQVETARAYAENRRDILTRLIATMCQVHLWSSIALMLTLTLLGGSIFSLWTHGKISFDLELGVLLGIGSIVGAYADVITTVLIGINRIWPVALGHALATVLALGAAAMLLTYWGAASMAAALIIPEISAAVIGIWTIVRLLSLPPQEFIVDTIRWPTGLLRHELQQIVKIYPNPWNRNR
jgi:O-antigen/teichoic acid export membrane protein